MHGWGMRKGGEEPGQQGSLARNGGGAYLFWWTVLRTTQGAVNEGGCGGRGWAVIEVGSG